LDLLTKRLNQETFLGLCSFSKPWHLTIVQLRPMHCTKANAARSARSQAIGDAIAFSKWARESAGPGFYTRAARYYLPTPPKRASKMLASPSSGMLKSERTPTTTR
jgi:hypothetical protein